MPADARPGHPGAPGVAGDGPAAPLPDPPPLTAAQVGAALAEMRESAGRTVDDVSAVTRIRGSVIRAMESGAFAACGGAVYARGHLRSIAAAVGADPRPLVEAFDRLTGAPVAGAMAAPMAPPPARAARERKEIRVRNGPNWTLAMIAAAAVVAIIALASLVLPHNRTASTLRQGTGHRAPVASQAPATSAVPHPRASSSATASSTGPVAGSGTVTATGSGTEPAVTAVSGVNVTVNVHTDPSWVHVVDESGHVLFAGILQPGDSRLFHAAHTLHFVFGFAPAVDLMYNGQDIGQPLATGQTRTARAVFRADTTGTAAPGSATG